MAPSGNIRCVDIYADGDPHQPVLRATTSPVIIFIGPNNSGKSLALREIEQCCKLSGEPRHIVAGLEIDFPMSPEDNAGFLETFDGLQIDDEMGYPYQRTNQPLPPIERLRRGLEEQDWVGLISRFTAPFTRRLDGRTRFSFVEPQSSGIRFMQPNNPLWALFDNDTAREKVRRLTEDAFKLHFVIDPMDLGQFKIRMSARAPHNLQEEKMLDPVARKFYDEARPIESYSDGVQAFVGLVLAVLAFPLKVIIVDEPEAFLHPPLARRLGGALSRLVRERGASLVVATHSPDFVMGCVEEHDTTIVRLTYEDAVASARVLEATQVRQMITDPLLRSTEVFSALPHRAAVVTEADADRAFYNEMNHRLMVDGRGIGDCVFLNAQNKQTVHRIVGPLRRIGIPAAAVVDLDALRSGGTDWERLLDACQVPPTRRSYLETERAYVANEFSGLTRQQGAQDPLKVLGIRALRAPDLARAQALLAELSRYGLLLVPTGELEHAWLTHISIPGSKSTWLVNLFAQIGQVESDPNYLKPSAGDVWEFLDQIEAWIADPSRFGTNSR